MLFCYVCSSDAYAIAKGGSEWGWVEMKSCAFSPGSGLVKSSVIEVLGSQVSLVAVC